MLGPSFSVVRSTEGGAVQCQWRTGIVEDLHADVSQPPAAEFCRARTVVLLLSMAVPAKAMDALRGYRSVATIQLDVENRRPNWCSSPWPVSRNAPPNWNGLIDRAGIHRTGRINDFSFKMHGPAVDRGGIGPELPWSSVTGLTQQSLPVL